MQGINTQEAKVTTKERTDKQTECPIKKHLENPIPKMMRTIPNSYF